MKIRLDLSLFLFLTVAGALIGTGCNRTSVQPTPLATAPTAFTGSGAIRVTVDAASNSIHAVFPNGEETSDWQTYAQLVSKLSMPAGVTLELQTTESAPAGISPEDVRLQAFGYQLRLAAETGPFIGGCIRQYNVPHINITLTRLGQQQPLFNAHLAAWKQGGSLCFGLYESVSRFCISSCGSTLARITAAIAAALIAVGITSAVANVIASVIAPIAFGLLAI
jgi:hypothetical protein